MTNSELGFALAQLLGLDSGGFDDVEQVSSSVIDEIAYDEDNQEMKITFNSGAEYIYSDVTRRKFENFVNAGSIGGYFNDKIRDDYIYSKL